MRAKGSVGILSSRDIGVVTSKPLYERVDANSLRQLRWLIFVFCSPHLTKQEQRLSRRRHGRLFMVGR
jgi:hypothetical protein